MDSRIHNLLMIGEKILAKTLKMVRYPLPSLLGLFTICIESLLFTILLYNKCNKSKIKKNN